jgi:lipooligosaccharide transport system ATP-binding protein
MESTPLLTGKNLTKVYGGRTVVDGVSVDIGPSEVVGFLGPNGAGKTTTVGMLTGMVLPTSGTIRFGDLVIPDKAPQARHRIGIVTQDDNLDGEFHARDNLLIYGRHYRLTRKEATQRADELLERTGLTEHATKRPDELSGGLRRRLTLARAIINRPALVFLDEPTTGLDPDSRQGFWRLVADLRAEGTGVVLTTHYMDEAQRLCDRLLLMQEGRIVDAGTPSELIDRVIGREVVEIEGVDGMQAEVWAQNRGAWFRPFGQGYLIAVPRELSRDAMVAGIEKDLTPMRLTHRPANLEDVFLRLTGSALDHFGPV